MKQKRFSEEQIAAVLKQAEVGVPVAELIRKMGRSQQTFNRWKKPYAGLEVDQVRDVKQLKEENAWLERLLVVGVSLATERLSRLWLLCVPC